jgi:hypothetical protein
MLTQRRCFSRLTRRVVIASAMTIGLVTLGSVSAAQELPIFRKGMWEFNRTIAGASGKTQTITTKKCTNPTDDMRKQNDMLTKAGCKFSPVTKSGSSYSFTSDCSIQGIAVQSQSVISVDDDTAYKVNIESQQGGAKTKEVLVAKRIGDC